MRKIIRPAAITVRALKNGFRPLTNFAKTWLKILKRFSVNVCHPEIVAIKTRLLMLFVSGNSGLCWTVFARNRDTVVPAEGNGDYQTLICVLVARPRQCLTLSNAVPWQNWMAAYLGYTLRMKTLFHGWPVMVYDTHTRRRRRSGIARNTEVLDQCWSFVYFEWTNMAAILYD